MYRPSPGGGIRRLGRSLNARWIPANESFQWLAGITPPQEDSNTPAKPRVKAASKGHPAEATTEQSWLKDQISPPLPRPGAYTPMPTDIAPVLNSLNDARQAESPDAPGPEALPAAPQARQTPPQSQPAPMAPQLVLAPAPPQIIVIQISAPSPAEAPPTPIWHPAPPLSSALPLPISPIFVPQRYDTAAVQDKMWRIRALRQHFPAHIWPQRAFHP